MEQIIALIERFDTLAYVIIGVNILLLIFAKQILKLVYPNPEKVLSFSRKVMTFRALNLLILLTYGYFRFFQGDTKSENKVFLINIIAVLAIIYFAYLAMHIAHGFLVRLYGKEREGEWKKTLYLHLSNTFIKYI